MNQYSRRNSAKECIVGSFILRCHCRYMNQYSRRNSAKECLGACCNCIVGSFILRFHRYVHESVQ